MKWAFFKWYASVTEASEVFEIIEIAFAKHADPYDLSGVG